MKISHKLILSLNGIIIALMVLMALIIVPSVSSSLSRIMDGNMTGTATLAANVLRAAANSSARNYLRGVAEKNAQIVGDLAKKAASGEMSRAQAMETARAVLQAQRIGTAGYIFTLDKEGSFALHPRQSGEDVSSMEFVRSMLTLKSGYLEFEWKEEGELAEQLKAAWFVEVPEWDWILVAATYKNELKALVDPGQFRDYILSIHIGKSGFIQVLDSMGRSVIHPDAEGRSLWNSVDATGKPYVQEMIRRKEGSLAYRLRDQAEGPEREVLSYFTSIQEFSWVVVASSDKSEIFGLLDSMVFQIIVSISLGTLVAAAIIGFLGSIITRPIRSVSAYLEAIAKGGADLTKRLPVKGKDELAQLSRNFNFFVDSLSGIIGQIKDSVSQLSVNAEGLASAAAQSSASLNEISVNTQGMEGKITLLDSSIQGFESLNQEIGLFLKGLSDQIARQDASIRDTHQQVASMVVSIDAAGTQASRGQEMAADLRELAHEGQSEMQGTIEVIGRISDATKTIASMLTLINEIAAQTNLLAMNAAIEAAHAGDSGRGFAVVAAEIRKLAEATSGNAKRISGALKDIMGNVRASEDAANRSGSTFEKMVREIAQVHGSMEEIGRKMTDSRTATQGIQAALALLVESSRSLDAAGRELEDKTLLLSKNIHTVSGIAHDSRTSMEEITLGVKEVTGAVHLVADGSVSSAENVERIQAQVGSFTLA